MIKFTFLAENKTDNPDCMAEHGLSVLIETPERKLLFDTGTSGMFLDNAKQLNVDLSDVDAVIISHGHYDHTQGVPFFCRVNNTAKIYIHEDAFEETYGMNNGTIEEKPCSIIWTPEERKMITGRLALTKGVTFLTEDIVISGTIPDVEGADPPETFYIKRADGGFEKDPMSHEQFLAIRSRDESGKSAGVFVFSGCSHKGVIPVLRYFETLFPGEKIKCLVAGMHLYSASPEVRAQVTSEVVKAGLSEIMPVHCTGIDAICQLKAALGDRCVVATSGDSYERY